MNNFILVPAVVPQIFILGPNKLREFKTMALSICFVAMGHFVVILTKVARVAIDCPRRGHPSINIKIF